MRDYEYSDLYFDAHLDKQIKIEVVGTGITIDNSMIELDAFELDEILCSEQELTFGSCEANCVKFTARDMPGSIVGKTIRITETVDGNADVPFSYGIYKVYSDVPTSDRTKREITAYDAMYDIVNADVKSWYAGLSFPMTLRQFRDSFFAYFGIVQKETALVNDGMIVSKTMLADQTDSESVITEESTISGKTVIEAICEINGVFGNINRDGEFEYIELKEIIDPLYPADNLYPADDLFPRDPNTISMTGNYITFDYEDFQSKEITQIEIRPADDSAGAIVGTSGNNYVISGNFLVSDKSGAELSQIAANTLSIIRKAAYTPLISSEVVGNPCIELGDPIRFNTTREIVESYVLQRTLAGIQNKRDSIVSPGTETHNKNPNSIIEKISSVQRRTNKLERTADHTLSELADLDASTSSRFEQTAEQIQTEVINRQNADTEMSSRITQTANEISQEVSARQGEDNEIKASLTLKIDRTDDGTIISLINGSADKIHFNANNMFAVDAPNITIDENGQVEIGGNFIADTAMYLCYNYASLPGIDYASKVNVLNICGGSFAKYYIASTGIFSEFFTATGLNTPVMKIGEDSKIQAVITDKQLQVGSIYATDGMFNDIALGFAIGTYGGRVYNCCDSVGDNGIASPGWVKNYVSSAGNALTATYATKCTEVASSSHTANCYIQGNSSLSTYKTIYLLPSGSSRRYKTDIEIVNNADLDPHRLYNLDVVQFKYKPSFYNLPEGSEMPTVIGFIAEDVDEKYPCACEYNEESGQVENWLERYMIPPMLSLIQEQHQDIESLKQENLALQNRLSILEQKMEEIANVINNQNN